MKITILGNAIVVKSAYTCAELATIGKYRPKTLTLWGGDDGKDALFTVGSGKGCGSLCKYGAVFGDDTGVGEERKATITLTFEGGVADPKAYVEETYGGMLRNLSAVEAQLEGIVPEIAAEKQALMDSITLA